MISVIIPNYNHSAFLQERIESVLNQNYTEFEVIILDDYSNDNSVKIIEQYKDNNKISHIIINEKNSGSTFKQWQKGISLAKGKYIWIAESDDYADTDFLEEVMKRFKADPEIGIVFCDSNIARDKVIDFNFYKTYRNNTFKTEHWNEDYTATGINEINNYLIFDNTINNTSAMVFKKELVKEPLYKNLNLLRYSGDWYFFLFIAQNCKISYISKAMNYFRQGTNNFAKGIKSPLNHFKERSIVRYLILKDFPQNINQHRKIFKSLGDELRYKLFELIKNRDNFSEFFKVCKELYKTDKKLFLKQAGSMFLT